MDCGGAGSVPVFRIADGGPPLVREALLACGWAELDREAEPEGDYNLWWKSSRFKPSELEDARTHGARRINHFPKSGVITRKDSLLRAMRRMRSTHGAIYSFTPRGFLLPTEYTKFVKAFAAQEKKGLWICKPSDMSRGRQIFLVRDLDDLTYSHQSVIQEYVNPPFLIEGYKHDLRLYVLVTSCRPMRAYLYDNGLVRFGTEKYDGSEESDIGSLFAHLTNASINKKNPERENRAGVMGRGAKWTLDRLRSYLARRGVDFAPVWRRIQAVIILSLLPLLSAVPHNPGCFELFGFDVILDAGLRPWVLEVNCSPALGADCDEDLAVKQPLLRDMVAVLDVPGTMSARAARERRADSRNRGRERLYAGAAPPPPARIAPAGRTICDRGPDAARGSNAAAVESPAPPEAEGAAGAAATTPSEPDEVLAPPDAGIAHDPEATGGGTSRRPPLPAPAGRSGAASASAPVAGTRSHAATLASTRSRQRTGASQDAPALPRSGSQPPARPSERAPRKPSRGPPKGQSRPQTGVEWRGEARDTGRFALLFPFNAVTDHLSNKLAGLQSGKHTPLQVTGVVKEVVTEVKSAFFGRGRAKAQCGESDRRIESGSATSVSAGSRSESPTPRPHAGRERPRSAQGSAIEAARLLRP